MRRALFGGELSTNGDCIDSSEATLGILQTRMFSFFLYRVVGLPDPHRTTIVSKRQMSGFLSLWSV